MSLISTDEFTRRKKSPSKKGKNIVRTTKAVQAAGDTTKESAAEAPDPKDRARKIQKNKSKEEESNRTPSHSTTKSAMLEQARNKTGFHRPAGRTEVKEKKTTHATPVQDKERARGDRQG